MSMCPVINTCCTPAEIASCSLPGVVAVMNLGAKPPPTSPTLGWAQTSKNTLSSLHKEANAPLPAAEKTMRHNFATKYVSAVSLQQGSPPIDLFSVVKHYVYS